MPPYNFLYNSVNSKPILIMFDTRNPEEIWTGDYAFVTTPERLLHTTLWNIIFATDRIIDHTVLAFNPCLNK